MEEMRRRAGEVGGHIRRYASQTLPWPCQSGVKRADDSELLPIIDANTQKYVNVSERYLGRDKSAQIRHAGYRSEHYYSIAIQAPKITRLIHVIPP